MKVLVIGSGGREHALVWKIAQSEKVEQVYCLPGNAGIAAIADCVSIDVSDFNKILSFVDDRAIDLTVVGPEMPLGLGIADKFREKGHAIVGPNSSAARMETSKAFSKELMKEAKIPTAEFKTCDRPEQAYAAIGEFGAPVVIKADGLAAGKGVYVCETVERAREAVNDLMFRKVFGIAGLTVVVEEYLEGQEASFICLTDSRHILPLAASQDHKQVFDDDKGPNTGGMGAYSPVPMINLKVYERILHEIMIPTVATLNGRGIEYSGFLYAGLMLDGDEIKVLEFNCRLGDPEAQPLLMRLETDIMEPLISTASGDLGNITLDWDDRTAVCVVMASKGYPGSYERGNPIQGLDLVSQLEDVMVFHAGTRQQGEEIITTGGRVLGVTALGKTAAEAAENAYASAGLIKFNGAHYRRDIARKAIISG